MKRILRQWVLVLSMGGWLVVMSGCGGSSQPATPSGAMKTYGTSELPGVVEAFPGPLDDGRVTIYAPEDANWRKMNRDNDYLARFQATDSNTPVYLVITAEPGTGISLNQATDTNCDQFYTEIEKLVLGRLGKNEMLAESFRLMKLGNNYFVRFVRKGKLSGRDYARQILMTVYDGRLYTVELRVRPDDLVKYRDAAYAVAAHMKFGGGGTAASPAAQPAPESTDLPQVSPDSGTGDSSGIVPEAPVELPKLE